VVIAVVIVVLAMMGLSIAFALSRSNGSGNNAGTDAKEPKSSARATTSSSAGTSAGGGTASSGSATGASETAAKSPSATASSTSGGGLPDGYRTVTNRQFHFSIAMPAGWSARDVAGQSSGRRYWGSARYPRLQIDYTGTPGKDAKAAWEAQESASRGGFPGYHLVSIKNVDYRGYRTAADWEFTFTSGGTTMRAVNRGFVTDDTHGYAIFFIAPDADWNGVTVKQMRDTFYNTFKPAK
jgi:hypothetical protein